MNVLGVILLGMLAVLVEEGKGSTCTQGITTILKPEEIKSYTWNETYTESYFIDALGTGDMYWIAKSGPSIIDVMRENADGSIPWVRRINSQQSVPKAHVLNNAGTTLWILDEQSGFNGIDLCQIDTSTAVLTSHVTYDQRNNDLSSTLLVSDDDTKLYYTAIKGTDANLCTFDISSLTSSCFSTGTSSPHGILRISDSRIIFFGVDISTSKGLIANIDPSPATATSNWEKLVGIPGGAAVMNKAIAATNTDKSLIYAAVPIGTSPSTTYLLFLVIDEPTGSLVGDSLVSDQACTKVDEVFYFSDRFYVIAQFTESRVLVFDPAEHSFSVIFQSTGSTFRGILSDTLSGRLGLIGGKSSTPIVYKVHPEHLSLNGELTNSSMGMSIATTSYSYSSRTYSYSAKSSSAHGSYGAHPNAPASSTETTLWETSVNRFEEPITIEANPSFPFDNFINITCSIGSSTQISYTLSSADTKSSTNWLTFTESNFSLAGTPPDSAADKTYNYTIVASWSTTPSGTATSEITVNAKSKATITAGEVAEAAAQSQVGVAAGVAVVNSALLGTPPTSLWSLLQQLQMLLLLMLIDEYTPSDINEFLEGMSFAMINFNFIPAADLPLIDIPLDWLDFGEPAEKVQNLGIESISTIVNNFSLVFTFICVIIAHTVLKIIPWFKNKNHPNCFIRNVSIIREKTIDIIFYIAYARLLLEAHETIVVTSALEIKEFDTSSTAKIISLLICCIFLLLCLIIPTFALYLFYNHRKEYDPEKKTPTMEFFAGLRNSKWARFYSFLLLFRRVFFVFIIIFMTGNVHRACIYSILLAFQVAYFWILICLRPFEELQDNIIELVNELFLTEAICYLFAMTSGDKWTDSAITWFMNSLIFNCLIVLGIMISFTIVNIIVKCRESRKSKESSSFGHLSVQEEPTPATENRNIKSQNIARNDSEEEP
ncbi:unnamed protein product [Moneuplotes crassus]|uniref:Uncharacterized protein n=1 Tax=Euplotes crassus TaxID=5936 RepID=A0AAD1UG04_EUPCR|nr:unnamed protein product [Moneuplotes crassus]